MYVPSTILTNLVMILIPILVVLGTTYVIRRSDNKHFTEKERLLKQEFEKKHSQEEVSRNELEELYRRRLISAALESQEAERKRIAAEIHDSFASVFSAIKINFQFMAKDTGLTEEVKQSILDCEKMLDEGIDISRRLANSLNPKSLEIGGLNEAIQELCLRVRNSHLFKIHFSASESPSRLEMSLSIQIYRVVQELISNCVKHSGATSISLDLHWGPILCITMLDNGTPFEYNFQDYSRSEGLGVLNMRNRLNLLDASIQTEKGPFNKTQLFIPIAKISTLKS